MANHLTKASVRNEKNEFTIRVSLDSQITGTETPFWQTVWNIFRNSFTQAFPETKNDRPALAVNRKIPLNKNAVAEEKRDKKDVRKEKRKERRDRRKEKRDKKWLDFNKADKRTAGKDNSEPL